LFRIILNKEGDSPFSQFEKVLDLGIFPDFGLPSIFGNVSQFGNFSQFGNSSHFGNFAPRWGSIPISRIESRSENRQNIRHISNICNRGYMKKIAFRRGDQPAKHGITPTL